MALEYLVCMRLREQFELRMTEKQFGFTAIKSTYNGCNIENERMIGTTQYIPEVLDGSIDYSMDPFLRVDMKACRLILWELSTRCTSQLGATPEYRLPFEEEIGRHPSLKAMVECVVHKRLRPAFKDNWKSHPGLIDLCDTIEECWEHCAVDRISARCIVERCITWQCREDDETAVTMLLP
ncbi:activin receptor type-2B-like [Metopolophium dirhodum]|uniref:activin receptor type-2B-like n=1 Tax=Metopolophium dirhodum TaxID=44670 RepID=UPI00298F5BAC|nr:activin receptor type-2B-like [Metopolophium dirhodum]